MSLRTAIFLALPLIVAGATSSIAQQQPSLSLSLPLDCKFGETCFIQQYFDHDPTKGVRDYRGGTMSYDGHNGVDLRVPTMAAQQRGVSVIAAADGVVKAVRDGIPDINVHKVGADKIAGRECGNGVLIEHGGGWSTLYCHMAKGSILVHEGDKVETGAKLGLVGLSGNTEFPHLHFSVGCNDVIVDPFDPDASACGATQSLWSKAAAAALAYHSPAVINFGFADETLSAADVEFGRTDDMAPTAESPALVAYVRAIGLRAKDIQSFTIKGPDGRVIAHSDVPPLDSNMAERFMYVGQRKAAADWPRGIYEADFEIRRDGETALTRRFSFELR